MSSSHHLTPPPHPQHINPRFLFPRPQQTVDSVAQSAEPCALTLFITASWDAHSRLHPSESEHTWAEALLTARCLARTPVCSQGQSRSMMHTPHKAE